MNNGSVIPQIDYNKGKLFCAKSLHNGEEFTFHTASAANHWLWLRDEYFMSLAYRGKLPEGYNGPALKVGA